MRRLFSLPALFLFASVAASCAFAAEAALLGEPAGPMVLIDSGPPAYTNDNTPSFSFTVTPGGAPATPQCRVFPDLVTPPAFGACSSASSYTTWTLPNGPMTFEVLAIDTNGNASPIVSYGFTVDTIAPTVSIGGPPFGSTNDTTPTFNFATSEGGSPLTVTCRVTPLPVTPSPPFGPCTTPDSHTPDPLADGAYQFEVRVIDAAGNPGNTDANRAFAIDTIGPKVAAINSIAVADWSPAGALAIDVAVTKVLVTFDEDMWVSGGPNDVINSANWRPVNAGPDGVIDTLACGGLVGDDILLPLQWTQIGVNSRTAAIAFGDVRGNQAGRYRLFACAAMTDAAGNGLDGAGDGGGAEDHAIDFAVVTNPRIVNPNFDLVGNVGWIASGPEPSSWVQGSADGEAQAYSGAARLNSAAGRWATWSLSQCFAYEPGNFGMSGLARVTSAAGGPTVSFSVHASNALDCSGALTPIGTSNSVQEDTAGAWLPLALAPIVAPPGTLALRLSFNVVGGMRPHYTVEIDRARYPMLAPVGNPTAPSVAIDTGPFAFTNDSTPSFTFSVTPGSAPATAQCRVYPSASTPPMFGACSGAGDHTTPTLGQGAHTFEVRASDSNGYQSPIASRSFTVDTYLPSVTITGFPPIFATNDTTPTFNFTASDGGGSPITVACRVTTNPPTPAPPFGPCTTASSHTTDPLADGDYWFEVRAVDAAGNTALSSRPIAIDTVAPKVTAINSVSKTDWSPTGAAAIDVTVTKFLVTFDDDMSSSSAIGLSNWEAVAAGPNGLLETSDCGSASGDDVAQTAYWTVMGGDYHTAGIAFADNRGMQAGRYRLIACAAISDSAGNGLDGAGDGGGAEPYVIDFNVLTNPRVVNPNFDFFSGPVYWTASGPVPSAWSRGEQDSESQPYSYAARLNTSAGAGATWRLEQCVTAEPGLFSFSGLTRITSATPDAPSVQLAVVGATSADCTGTLTPIAVSPPVVGDTAAAWPMLIAAPIILPPGTQSLRLSFDVSGGAAPNYTVEFDRALYPGRIVLFDDSFESE